jgi:ribosomal protein L37E
MNFNQQEYIKEFEKRKALNSCHRCGMNNFEIVEGYSYFPIQENPGNMMLGEKNIPTILVVCTNCGAITPHAIGVFKPLEDKNEKEVKNV